MVLEGEGTCLRSQAGRAEAHKHLLQLITIWVSVDPSAAVYVMVVNEACPSRLSPQAQRAQSTESLLRRGALEHVQYLAALTDSVWASR